MIVRILGSAAGGGFPQWDCSCGNCKKVRRGAYELQPRTQSSLALLDPHSRDWVLINASPDIRQQMLLNGDRLGPGPRDTNLQGIVLCDSQMDHAGGLPLMRESQLPLSIYGTGAVYVDLKEHYPALDLLAHYCGYHFHTIEEQGEPFQVAGFTAAEILPIAVPGKAPPYSPARDREQGGETIALRVAHPSTGRSILYAPSIDRWSDELQRHALEADVLLVEGTCWHDDDLIRSGCKTKRGSDMGHIYLNGEGGLLAVLAQFPEKRRILIHINNTNPILDPSSAAYRACQQQGVEIATDGMEIVL